MSLETSYLGPPAPAAMNADDSSSTSSGHSSMIDSAHYKEGSSGAAGGSLPLSCKECRASKVKCERVFPCARCVRLGLKCSPQVRKKRRQPSKAIEPLTPPTVEIKTRDGIMRLKHTPISGMMKAFFELKENGQLNIPRGLCVFRSWVRMRQLYGLKPLEYVQDLMLSGLGVEDWRAVLTSEDLHRQMASYTGDEYIPEPPPPNRVSGQPINSPNINIDNLPFFMKELFYSTNCACKLTVCEDAVPVTFANDLFERLFNPTPGSGAESLFYTPPTGKPDASGMSLSECMIRAIHPLDGAELYVLLGNLLFGGQSNPCGISHIVRCRTARGESFMAMVRARFYLKDGGRFWAQSISFQPLPMSRFLFPLAKPLGPAEANNAASFASLSVFEEPTQPQTARTCEVMTREQIVFHFRGLSDQIIEGDPTPQDLLADGEEGDEDEEEDNHKKPRIMPPPPPMLQHSHHPNMLMAPPPPPPMANTYCAPATMPPPQATSYPPAVEQQPAAMYADHRPQRGSIDEPGPQAAPSFNLTQSEVEVLDAFLAVGDGDGDSDTQNDVSSWEDWASGQTVGDDFWQVFGNPAEITGSFLGVSSSDTSGGPTGT